MMIIMMTMMTLASVFPASSSSSSLRVSSSTKVGINTDVVCTSLGRAPSRDQWPVTAVFTPTAGWINDSDGILELAPELGKTVTSPTWPGHSHWSTDWSIHSYIRSFICSFVRSRTHSLTHSLTHSFKDSIIYLLFYSFIHSSIHSFIR